MSATVPVVAVRGSTGISMNYGPPGYDPVPSFTRDDSKNCKTMLFSPDGRYFAWVNGVVVKIVSTATWKPQCEIPRPKVCNAAFSPLGTYLITWEPFIQNQSSPQGGPNLHFYKADTGELVHAFIHKNQIGWEPQWSSDETLCARLLNNDVLFYENHSFKVSVNKCSPAKVAGFSLSPGPAPNHVLCYLPGASGQPSFGRLFQYPRFDIAQSIANKSFFQSDRLEMHWNVKGTGVLLMTNTDVDKTGGSYYGKQTLHYISTKGDTSMVILKEGPVYSVQWSPKGNEFCVIHGYVPARASIFNVKCESVHEFGTGARNSIYYNPFGNLLILAGFGNLRGPVEIWDAVQRRIVARVDAPDTTLLQWSPDGEHFVTATTAPRLRQGNGFKIWHYSGSLLYERPWNKQEELWEVSWQSFPKDSFKEPTIRIKPVEGIQPSVVPASKTPYRPPSARGREPIKTEETSAAVPESMSKNALKLRKKREARKAKKESDGPAQPSVGQQINNSHQTQHNHHGNGLPDVELPDDPEKAKKIKKVRGKLNDIAKLKELRASGKSLEINQLEKIKKEEELIKELNSLVL